MEAHPFALIVPLACTLLGVAQAQSPVVFEPNRGQAAPEVDFVARTADGAALLDGVTTALLHGDGVQRMEFLGANAACRPEAGAALPGLSNYLRGDDSGRWVTGVPQFAAVRYLELYPGVDLAWGSRTGRLEYDLELEAGVDLASVAIRFGGVDDVHVDAQGDLHVVSGERDVIHRRPVSWQTERDGARCEIDCRFVVKDGIVRFAADGLDPALPLTIDPTLVFSTYFGGTLLDIVGGMAVDAAGNVLISGSTTSIDMPMSGGFQTALAGGAGDRDAFVAKLSADGTTLLWSTYLGGSAFEVSEPSCLALDAAGRPCLAGSTSSTNFPTTAGCAQSAPGGETDAFVAVLTADGSALAYSTYLGGPAFDSPRSIAVDPQGRLVVVGGARAGFPTTPAAYATFNSGDVDVFVSVIAPLSAGAADLAYSTFVGGSLFDRADDVAVDVLGRIHVCATSSTTKTSLKLPTTSTAFRPTLSIANNDTSTKYAGYYAVLAPNGNGVADLAYASFVNSRQAYVLTAYAVVLDAQGRAFITGCADGATIPTTANGRDLSANGGQDSYLLVVNSALSGSAGVVYGSYIGSTDADRGNDVALGSDGRVYIVGFSSAITPPPGSGKKIPFPTTADALRRVSAGNYDGTLTVLDLTLAPSAQMTYSTMFGGTVTDCPVQIKEWSNRRFFVAGYTGVGGTGFPTTPGAFDTTHNGDSDGFVMRFDF